MTSALHSVRRAIGILGGTFDPIHYGHLRPAEEVRQTLMLSELRLIPAGLPPHRERPATPAAVRLDLVRRAVADDPNVTVDERELRRSGPSYTFDTLTEIRAEAPDAALCLIVGRDSFYSLPAWYRWRELADLAHIVVTERPGAARQVPEVLARWAEGRRVATPEALRAAPAGGLLMVPVTPLDISATGIRRALANGRSIRGLMPEAARQRVATDGLYGYPQL